ncbi:ribosomal-processing cysteine protease Prp [Pediococcus acidilactici]|uniref:ribosomal-processing cysteine protease Prp n=1 Tax=Pediococcus acidilactici TaxID=1254 RepID=UPI000E5CEEEA|nr:ribosomal-processing cysteine protease Prp [Pediococcus acidilactici]KAF0368958.1 ribosomal-processing cysteine protease Prp [Pediococcus acidilactici]KAF0465485.1 ribosomal-processing cysteine protease Prp [Pediococcus acidilactici]KAF0473703.1 ribosomal-processing cysteine protease Prp [Pediococcus acidilactici]KAF0490153.1 ribosomal-processing cysteine protease Prp [Pediococcus acidilactici]KAF0516880.1 ribosomal-processing cysteine protease Prp [Pediococcus acidilactici]
MIQAWIYREADRISGFKLTGHADAGEYGKDIVCAAVSVLAINTVNSIEQIASVMPLVESDDDNGGFLSVNVPESKDREAEQKAQVLLASFELGLRDISKTYDKYLVMN